MRTAVYKAIMAVWFVAYLCAAAAFIAWLFNHGSSAAFELGLCFTLAQPVIIWRFWYEVKSYKHEPRSEA